MSLVKRGDIWHYDFWFLGRRYVGTTRQTVKADASVCEQEVKRRLRRQSAGLEGPPAAEAPRFQDWAEVHFRERRPQMTRPEFLEDNLRVILRFWGARPKQDDHLDDPYHDLRLHDPIRDPKWIERFEAWMRSRGSSPQTRNHYRIGTPPVAPGPTGVAGVMTAQPSSLVKRVRLPANRVFHRFSAFRPDRRVDSVTGSLRAGTYAAPASEVPFVPTGFIAVGRFALPNNLPASHHYEVEALAGTLVEFGTVTPAFGQSGGGVEAYFAKAVTNAQSPPVTHQPLPDE